MLLARSLAARRLRLRVATAAPSLLARHSSASVAGLSAASHAASSSPVAAPKQQLAEMPELTLTPNEDSLFAFLVYIGKLYAPSTQLRVAGGWVRDKLRGAESEDIDVALDNLRGAKFARCITRFQRERRLPPSSVGVVKANSDKSKHLEVATVNIEGRMVDLVHLRAEAYTADSRVPEVSFATPEDDATRRDLTINALFYNLHTRRVEDFTGRGLEDLRDGVIRTPREPVQTFLDDPLRVLRALRFACEFGFELDPALAAAVLQQREIVRAMRRKVSRERIGIELRKMFSGKNPARGFQMLADFHLLELVFNDVSCRLDEESEAADVDEAASLDSAATAFLYPPREWTEAVQQRAVHYLQYLQTSRLALAGCQISFVEATAAVFTPLFVPTLPAIVPSPSLPRQEEAFDLANVTDQQIIESGLAYLKLWDAQAAKLSTSEVVEMLKVHVKWPKPAGKRVALIIEAVATFPELSDQEAGEIDHQLKRIMWMTQYYSVVSPALTILASASSFESEDEATATLKTHLDLATAYAKGDDNDADKSSTRRRRLDGYAVQALLGPGAKGEIARALRVLQVWEIVHPTASVEEEQAFLERLAPHLR
ncbi:hypothetical protein BBJ28_00020247 [Nothophytophthora sp. Chile5]|nr:hypothetical protein BBJ28_00020247 [Nothophytophthora sp. Chile5]